MKYTHTPEHAARWPEFRDRWIQIAMRTDPMTAEERVQCTQAAVEMYRLAGFSAPRVVFVSAPIQAAMVAGCASWILHNRKPSNSVRDATQEVSSGEAWKDIAGSASPATLNSTWNATRSATSAATLEATAIATRDATSGAISDSSWSAAREATGAATGDATRDAISDATRDATRNATEDATWGAVQAATSEVAMSASSDVVGDVMLREDWRAAWKATQGATEMVSADATWRSTREATYDAIRDATLSAVSAVSAVSETESRVRGAVWDVSSNSTWREARDATQNSVYAVTMDATVITTDDLVHEAIQTAASDSASTATWVATRNVIRESVILSAYSEAFLNTAIKGEFDIRLMNWDATFLATRETQPEPSLDKWYVTPPIAEICTRIAGKGGLNCTSKVDRLRQGGNQWAGWPAMAEWFREVAELPLDWTPWMPWVTLAEHSGPRYLHEKFVVISDFPEVLKVDNENRPHCSEGPFCRWRDGTSLYAWHGIRVPAWIIERPERITIELIDKEDNAEVRRVMLDRYGFARYLKEKKAEVVDVWIDEGCQPVTLYRMPTDDDEGKPMVAVHLLNSTPDPDGTIREYVVRVDPSHTRAQAARNSTYGLGPEDRMTAVS